jgi:hypothetical protein
VSNHNHITVIESSDYVREVQVLTEDPIVVQMALEIRGDVSFQEIDSHNFMSAANAEYRARGGTQNQTLGGVPRAIKSLLIDWGHR